MLRSYYRRVHQRALSDTRHALSMETRQRVVRHFLVAVLSATVVFVLLNMFDKQQATVTRIIISAAPFAVYLLVFFMFYLWNFVTSPAKIDKEVQDKVSSLENSKEKTRNIWLFDAICRIYLGKWEVLQVEVDNELNSSLLKLDSSGNQRLSEICDQVRQLAHENRLKIWGKKPGFFPQQVWELIDTKFWTCNNVDYLSLSNGDPKKVRTISLPFTDDIQFKELMTSRETIDYLCYSGAFQS